MSLVKNAANICTNKFMGFFMIIIKEYEPVHESLACITYAQNHTISAHVDVSSGARCLNFNQSLHLHTYFLYMRTVKALVSLFICAGWPELPLLDYVISTKISCTGSTLLYLPTHEKLDSLACEQQQIRRPACASTQSCLTLIFDDHQEKTISIINSKPVFDRKLTFVTMFHGFLLGARVITHT